MKKSIIALMGLFTLMACSEDSYQEADKMNETGAVIENGSGGMQTNSYDPNTGYTSPYDISYSGGNVHYIISNNLASLFSLTITVTPVVGLAYYDGSDDGQHYTPFGTYDLTNGLYPNIYQNRSEYLNLIEGVPLVYSPLTTDAMSTQHCPTLPGFSPNHFDVIGAGATVEEAALLARSGKIYYYKVDISDPSGFIGSYINKIKFEDDSIITPATSYYTWDYLGLITSMPDNFYYEKTSKEIIAGNTTGGTLSRNYFYSPFYNHNFALSLHSDSAAVILDIN